MSLFFFGNNFYKNKKTLKIFSPQILEFYRILLVETTLELIMFYYTFSVINTTFVPCIALRYDSTAATRTIKLSTTLLSISGGIRLISFLMKFSLVCGLFSQTVPFRYPLSKYAGWDLGNKMARGYRFDAKWICPMGGYAWDIQVFYSRNKVAPHFSNRTEHLNTSGITFHGTDPFHVKPIISGHPIPKISTYLSIFWGGTWTTEFVDIIRREIRWIPEEMLNRVVGNVNVRVAAVLSYSSTVHGTNIVLITGKV